MFSRRGVEKDERARAIEDQEIERLRKDQADEIRIIRENALNHVKELLVGNTAANRVADDKRNELWIDAGSTITDAAVEAVPRRRWKDIQVNDSAVQERIDRIFVNVEEQANVIKTVFDEKIGRLKKGDELPPGVFKLVKVQVAIKRKLSVGDKMAGRHGNKGVISRILPEEDMPYRPDGTPVDIVLNPLGVPSRMNVGQILETHLGWAALGLGKHVAELYRRHSDPETLRERLKEIYADEKIAKQLDDASEYTLQAIASGVKNGIHMGTAVFDGAKEDEVKQQLEHGGMRRSGQEILFDGRSGQAFDHDVTVGRDLHAEVAPLGR